MKHLIKIVLSLSVVLVTILIPDDLSAQISKSQDNIQSRPIRFNHKKLMKMKNPSLEITDKIDNPFLRAEYDRARLVNPRTGKIPNDIKQKELDFVKSSRSGLSIRRTDLTPMMVPGDQTSPWINRGPFNVGGRTRALAIDRTDENILFAGGVSGGLWRSTDQGLSWTKLTPGQEHPSITDIMQDPRPGFENVWYYSTGERIGNSASDGGAFYGGNGVYKSTNGGLTFNVLPATQNNTPESFSAADPFDLIFGIDINPLNGDLYVATYVGVHRSIDGGNTFEEVLAAPFDNESDIHITSGGVLYATVASDAVDAGIFRSTIGAPGTWTNITPGGFPATFNRTVITTAPSNEDILYLLSVTPGGGTLGMSIWKYTYLSGDGSGAGGLWEDRSANVPALGGSVGNFNPQGGYNLIVRVHPLDENLVFVGGTNLYRSFDGFATPIGDDNWIAGYAVTNDVSLYTNQHPDHHGLEFFASNPDKALSSHDGGVSLTEDIQAFDAGGPFGNESVTWSDLNNGYLTTQTYALSIGPGDQLQAGFQDQSTWFTNNTGSTNPWTVVAGADGSYNAFNGDGTLRYVSFQNGTTFRQEYTNADSDIPLTQDFITPNGASGFLFVNPYELDPNNRDIMYLAAGTTLWRNDNLPNATPVVGWSALTNATVSGTVSAIGISTNPGNIVYIGSTGGQVIRINNANIGNPTGIDVTGANFPAGANVTSIDVNPNNSDDVIVTFSNYSVVSIFQSLNGGSTWTDVSGNLEENPDGSGSGPSVRWVTRIGFNDRFFAATSVGLYSTDQLNGSATVWTQEDPNGIGNVVIEQIRKRDSDGLVVLGTHGNGLYSANFEVTPPPILITNPLADFEVEVNSSDTIIDISNVFQSTLIPPATFAFSVLNDNPGLLTASLSGSDLTISFSADQFGDALITLTADDGQGNQTSDVFQVTVNPPPLIITEFPYLETFELGPDGPGSLPRDWNITATPPYSWTVNNGPTPTGAFNNATGPIVDHTTGTANGFYVYTEASGGQVGDTTELVTPPVVITSLENPAFEFWYHLFGDDIVSFEVQVVDEVNETTTTVFTSNASIQTAQNDPYLLQIIPLTDYGDTVRVVFRGIRGAVATDGFLGDMAIDDVRFFEAPIELVVADPTELTESLEKGQTSTQTFSLTNISEEDVTFDITIEDAEGGIGVSASTVTLATGRANQSLVVRTEPFSGEPIDLAGIRSLASDVPVGLLTTEQYATGFENFLLGDVNGQDGWIGQFGNWTIEGVNASEGSQHFRGLSDGLGTSLAFSPQVPIGSEEVSSVSARLNIQGTGVTWQLTPQSTSEELVNTRLQFNPDGTIVALVSDGLGGAVFQPLEVSIPSGYFKVDIEVNRTTSEFTIFFDDEAVFSGLGFAGNIEEVVVISLMEVAGPTLDLDELQILDGEVERGVPFLSIDPTSGTIPAGSSVNIEVTFDATQQEFGTFTSNIVVAINGGADEPVVVPATLSVVGDPTIFVDPTVVQAVVDFDKPETRIVSIENTGGSPLEFDLSVIGADIGVTSIDELKDQLNAYSINEVSLDNHTQSKLALDRGRTSSIEDVDPDPILITIGEPIFDEDFEGGSFPPIGWTVVDNEGTGVVWDFAAGTGEGNYAGTGEAATVSSDLFGPAEFDTELITPAINVARKSNLTLEYSLNYQNFSTDVLDLDISTDGGASWITLINFSEDVGSFRNLPGNRLTVPLDTAIAGASEIQLRWRYYNPASGDFDWYAQIDDVVVNENTEVWMALDQTNGVVPVGETAEIELQFDPTVVDPGFYVAGIIVNSNAVNTPIVGVVTSMQELEPAKISVSPSSLEEELVAGRSATQLLTISNSGESALDFDFEDNFPNVGTIDTTAAVPNSLSTAVTVKERRTGEADLLGIRALRADGLRSSYAIEPPVEFSDVAYATNYEIFAQGDINLQQGWVGQFVNWVIDTSNPGGNDQHIRSVSDGLGQTLAFSPDVGVGSSAISSTSMLVDLGESGVTWQIIPQSNTQELVITRLSFDADDSVRVLVADNGGEFQTIPIAKPEGYFEVKIEVERNTNNFVIYFDNVSVFSGNGFAGDIEQVVLFSLMEIQGPTFDLDNLQIVDGVIPELSLSASPQVGTIPSGESLDVTVTFDATNLEGGVYEEDLIINNNDPLNDPFTVPTTLTVIDPQIIEIDPESLTETLPMGGTSTQTLSVSNVGVADLNFKISIDGDLVVPGTSFNESAIPTSRDWQSDDRILLKLEDDNNDPITNDPNDTPVGRMGTVALLFEDFEDSTFPPADWTVVDNEGTGVVWQFAADYGEGNYAGSGEAATASSDAFGVAEFDTELITPEIAIDGQTGLVLEYLVNYQNFAASDFLDVDITTDGGTTWVNMLSWNEDHGAFFSTPGELVSINLDTYLVGATSFQIRWRYYDPNTGDFDWYAQIDDVVIGVPWLSLSVLEGVVPGGETVDIDVNFDATVLEPGDYSTNLMVCSDDLRNPEDTIPVSLHVIAPATIGFVPEVLELTLYEGFDTDTSFFITNSGDVDLNYDAISLPSFIPSIGNGNGTIAPDSDQLVEINVSAETLMPGNYAENILIESNDPNDPIAEMLIDLTVLDLVVLDMELEAVCSDNPDEERRWRVFNPNAFAWEAFWFIIGSSESDDILLQPGDNFFTSNTLDDRPNTLKLRWLDEDDATQEAIAESDETPCEVLDLNLTSVCSNNPDLFRRWRVRNPNPFGIMVTWVVVGTSQTSSLWTEGNSDTFFYTETISGPNTTIIKWLDENGDEQQNVKASSGEMCDVDNSCFGGEVVAFNQGQLQNGKDVLARRSNAENALGTPEENDEYNFVSLGFGGSIDIRLSNVVVDQPGNDFRVIETSFNDINRACEAYPETADVFVSLDGIEYFFVGSACKDVDFDIASSGLMEIEYVRVVDTSNPGSFSGYADGFDLDGIHCINSHFSGAAPVSFGLANTIPDEENDEAVTFPNPFVDEIAVKMKVDYEGKFVIKVHDNLGVLVSERVAKSTAGQVSTEIDAGSLASGTYIVTITAEDGSFRSSNVLIKQ